MIKAKFVDVWEMPNLPHDRWPWSQAEVARMVSLDPGWDESWGWRPEYEVAKWERWRTFGRDPARVTHGHNDSVDLSSGAHGVRLSAAAGAMRRPG